MEKENYYKDIKEILEGKKVNDSVKFYEDNYYPSKEQIAQRIYERSLEQKKAEVQRKKVQQQNIENVKQVTKYAGIAILLSTVTIGSLTLPKTLTELSKQEQLEGIKAIILEQNEDVSKTQLEKAANDAYKVLNSKQQNIDEQIYYSFCNGTADEVLECTFEIANNQEQYEFIPDGGYNVSIDSKNMEEYLSKTFSGYSFEEARKIYETEMKNYIDTKTNKTYESLYEESQSKKM